jgi:hypothetical protein
LYEGTGKDKREGENIVENNIILISNWETDKKKKDSAPWSKLVVDNRIFIYNIKTQGARIWSRSTRFRIGYSDEFFRTRH